MRVASFQQPRNLFYRLRHHAHRCERRLHAAPLAARRERRYGGPSQIATENDLAETDQVQRRCGEGGPYFRVTTSTRFRRDNLGRGPNEFFAGITADFET